MDGLGGNHRRLIGKVHDSDAIDTIQGTPQGVPIGVSQASGGEFWCVAAYIIHRDWYSVTATLKRSRSFRQCFALADALSRP